MALNQYQRKFNIFTWIIAIVIIVSVFAGAISSLLLTPRDKANASQTSSIIRSAPIPANINTTSSATSVSKSLQVTGS